MSVVELTEEFIKRMELPCLMWHVSAVGAKWRNNGSLLILLLTTVYCTGNTVLLCFHPCWKPAASQRIWVRLVRGGEASCKWMVTLRSNFLSCVFKNYVLPNLCICIQCQSLQLNLDLFVLFWVFGLETDNKEGCLYISLKLHSTYLSHCVCVSVRCLCWELVFRF